jgi:hypothetical protein
MKNVLSVILTTLWISLSEFVRNQFLLSSYWVNHYLGMGLVFPAKPLNGVIWGIWSLVFALVIFILAKKFSLLQTAFLSWVFGFFMMWLVVGNLGVLPFRILWYAVPLSMLEAFIAALVIKKFQEWNSRTNPGH